MASETGTFQSKTCFVCGKTNPGKHVAMNNFKMKYSKCEILEKLGNIVGNNLLVVCCKGDVICQHCVSVMQVIDKLENELNASKKIILRLLENKYNLKTKYAPMEEVNLEEEVEEVETQREEEDAGEPELLPPGVEKTESLFAIRKRKSKQAVEELANNLENDPRQRVWLECDKCHYTTNYTTFMDRHVRPLPCENCLNPMQDGVCKVCVGPVLKMERSSPTNGSPCPPLSPTSFLQDENELSQIVEEGATPDTSQIILTATETEDGSDKTLTYLEFEDGDIEQKEVFHVTGDMEHRVIWEES